MQEQFLEKVQERDIDLLLLEELNCSDQFRKWFISKTIKNNLKFIIAKHSVVNSMGESDIEVDFKDIKILIENKIDAPLQQRQAERYKERGEWYIKNKLCKSFSTILISPKKYGKKEGFDYYISYEDIWKWFNSKETKRDAYRANIIKEAVEQVRRGYQLIPNKTVSDFWKNYWNISNLEFPELEMPKPSNKPIRAGFIYFKAPSLGKLQLVHKLPHGNVDLQIPNQGGKLNELKLDLPTNSFLTRAGKSAAIRLKVPIVDVKKDFSRQEIAIRRGLSAARELLLWYKKVGKEMIS